MDKDKILSIVIPTKNRPEKLRKCLTSISGLDDIDLFEVVVCDSSTEQSVRDQVSAVCDIFPFARLSFHDGANVAAARNACANAARTDTLVNVDDDIYLQPDSVSRLLKKYLELDGWKVVAGSVKWDDWSRPIKMRLIGYGRPVHEGEEPDFLIGAFFIYSRVLALTKPWNEGIRTSDDRLMGALWRSLGVTLGFEESARAVHDLERTVYRIDQQNSHIYANLFDAVVANPNIIKAICYEVLGFIWGAKASLKEERGASQFVSAWIDGHKRFWRDFAGLRESVREPLPAWVEHHG